MSTFGPSNPRTAYAVVVNNGEKKFVDILYTTESLAQTHRGLLMSLPQYREINVVITVEKVENLKSYDELSSALGIPKTMFFFAQDNKLATSKPAFIF